MKQVSLREKVKALMERAQDCLDQNEYLKGINLLLDVIELDKTYADAFFYLARAFNELGKPSEAINNYQKCINIGLDLPEKEGNECVWASFHNLGLIYSGLNRDQEAIACYKQCVQLAPGFSYAYSNLAIYYSEWGQYDEGIGVLEYGIKVNRGFAKDFLYDALAKVYFLSGRYEDALVQWKECLKLSNAPGAVLSEDKASIYHKMACAYYELGREDVAKVYSEKAIELGWKDSELNGNLMND